MGGGLDVGGATDPLSLYREIFLRMKGVKVWDKEDGNGQMLEGIDNNSLDFLHSSHCLEHLDNPKEALHNWFRVVRPNGHLVITVPDEDLYEQGQFPSVYNADHKWTFTIQKTNS